MMMLPSTYLGWPLSRLHTLNTPLVATYPSLVTYCLSYLVLA